jgi:hypothetical protein
VGGVGYDHAGGEQVELDAACGVAGVGAAVDLQDDRNSGFGPAKFVRDLRDETALAFVAERNADVCDELAGKRNERHGCGKLCATESKRPVARQ